MVLNKYVSALLKLLHRLRGDFWLIRHNWNFNHLHHGGLLAVLRCLVGTYRIEMSPPNQIAAIQPDWMTFSVVPGLTFLWAGLVARLGPEFVGRILIGDCSGGFNGTGKTSHQSWVVKHLLNYSHGQKSDLFFLKVCKSEYVVVCDDDVLWLDSTPIEWALQQMMSDPKVAVVSLLPRGRFQWAIDGKSYQPMGSYCLVVRRSIWQKENLPFLSIPGPSINPQSYKGEYDTADYANVELIKRGYRVVIAPDNIREHIIGLKGISSAIMDIHKHKAGILSEISIPAEKLFSTLTLVKGLQKLILKYFPGSRQVNEFGGDAIIDKAYLTYREKLDVQAIESIEQAQSEILLKLDEVFQKSL
ncbi:MAG: hypothetical protein CVU44_14520 [Chloroflexi bacterium HGW-Chloroflexi-6]|nr:MAG: hypothetical protein CVU44_14520 [Chloroflexi bacterium HGW-Chloroflexi-6]